MAEEGRLCHRDDLGLVVEAPDGRILAEVALTDGADFTKHVYDGAGAGVLGWGVDVYNIAWFQFTDEPRGYIDLEAIEVPIPIAELEQGGDRGVG
jgi:hypothetical protein